MPKTVVGVVGGQMQFPRAADVLLPLTVSSPSWDSRSSHFLRPVGRLRPGVSVSEAQAEMDVISRRLEEAYPDTNVGFYAQVQPLQEVIVGALRPALLLLLGAVGLILLIACGNVSNLLLARSISRRGEVALRSAVGASRARVLRQLVTESLTLSLAGGGLGLAIAYGTVEVVQRFPPANLPRVPELSVDGTVLGFTLMLATIVGLLFGLIPAIKLSGVSLTDDLDSVRSSRGASGGHFRNALVTSEVALLLVLLVGASLLVKSFSRLRSVDPGLDPSGVLSVPVSFPSSKYRESAEVRVALDQMISGVEGIPGVRSVSAVSPLPFGGSAGDTYVYAEGRPPERIMDMASTALVNRAAEGYFGTMGIPLISGRAFLPSDVGDEEAPPVMVISEGLADRLWPSENAVGQRLVVPGSEEVVLEVVGIARNVKHWGLGQVSYPAFYLSQRQFTDRGMRLVIKGSGAVGSLDDQIREAVWAVDTDQTLTRISRMEDLVARSTGQSRFQSSLLGGFAALAILLAAMGVYGVLAYSVTQRRHELGIRMAMGADRRTVTRMVLRTGALLCGAGIVIGLAGAFGLARLMGGLLFEVDPHDLTSFMSAPALLAIVALLASYLPARRASRVDPVAALREDPT